MKKAISVLMDEMFAIAKVIIRVFTSQTQMIVFVFRLMPQIFVQMAFHNMILIRVDGYACKVQNWPKRSPVVALVVST